MAEFLRLSKAVEQSEQTLSQLSEEISRLQANEEIFQRKSNSSSASSWELEQKLEHLADCRTKAEGLNRYLRK